MNLQVNKSYLDQYNQQVNIVRYSSVTKLFYDEDSNPYDENGLGVENNFNDLVKEIVIFDEIHTKIIDDNVVIFFGENKQTLSKEKALSLYIELHKFVFDSCEERNNTQDKETII